MIELIGIDVDGTLFRGDMTVSDRTRSAIQAAVNMGVKVVLNTGRLPLEAAGISVLAGCEGQSVIGCNGAYAVVAETGKEIIRALPKEKSGDLLRLMARHQVAAYAFQPSAVYTNIIDEKNAHTIWWHSVLDRWNVDIVPLDAEGIIGKHSEGLLKIVALDADAEKLKALRIEMNALGGLSIAPSMSNNIECMQAGVDKGSALLKVAEELDIPRENIMAIGDNDNDIPMIRAAALGIAMGNASLNAKAAAKHVTATNDDDGVARVIEKFVLGIYYKGENT